MELPRDLIVRAQRGESEAQKTFLRRYAGPVRSLVRRVRVDEDVDDQIQEIYAKLLEVLPQFRLDGAAQLTTWVFTVVHRFLLMRKRKVRLSLVALEDDGGYPDPRVDVEALVAARQMREQLDAAIARLPEEQRRVFVLTQLHQQPLQVVAETEGVALGTVKSRLHRARAELLLSLGDALELRSGKGDDRALGK